MESDIKETIKQTEEYILKNWINECSNVKRLLKDLVIL